MWGGGQCSRVVTGQCTVVLSCTRQCTVGLSRDSVQAGCNGTGTVVGLSWDSVQSGCNGTGTVVGLSQVADSVVGLSRDRGRTVLPS